ncbi:unnamed protein product [Owenia fusiformis]|uniref:Uncharacterized protein n=1 Tax=Owenia fusiformis TaxID=6347 RepID=A0A8J1TX46_OWEFU|nr:unnamed protein product [Owenia fusiformis]
MENIAEYSGLVICLLQMICGLTAAEWSDWSKWSDCSRTCDGGASYQLRKCTIEGMCEGDDIRYRTCNMKDCRGYSRDFRTKQCEAYNDVPHNGGIYKWEPIESPEDPCALICKARHSSELTVKLAPKVLDGTRCEHSKNMCINGKCRKLGCDGVLDSPKAEDECGVCGGDGSSCDKMKPRIYWEETDYSECSVSCGIGYEVTSTICKDRFNNKVINIAYCKNLERPKPKEKMCKRLACLPVWVSEPWTECSQSCNGGVTTRKVYCAQEKENGVFHPVEDGRCVEDKPTNRKACNEIQCPIWMEGAWSMCSATCGVGKQYREVVCKQTKGLNCRMDLKPITSRECHTWTPCINTMETEKLESGGRQVANEYGLSDHNSLRPGVRPDYTLEGDETVVDVASFVAEPWGPCAATCGKAIRIRKVRCKIYLEYADAVEDLPDEECNGTKPAEIEPCLLRYCPGEMPRHEDNLIPHGRGKYEWQYTGFTACTASCMPGGFQESISLCTQSSDGEIVSNELCADVERPPSRIQMCNQIPCPPQWRTHQFGQCNATCGYGVETRKIECVQDLHIGKTVNKIVISNNFCTDSPPETTRTCKADTDCDPVWVPGQWSECSEKCGRGLKSRIIHCQQQLASGFTVNVTESRCSEQKPSEKLLCNNNLCPRIVLDKSEFVQILPRRVVDIGVGGKADVLPGVTIRVKCPVKHFNKKWVLWKKEEQSILKKGRVKVLKSGKLRIRKSSYKDGGTYTCYARNESATIRISFHSRVQANHLIKYRKKYLKDKFKSENSIFKHKHKGNPNLVDDTWNDNFIHFNQSESPFVFIPGDWSRCSVMCGGYGVRRRNVTCELINDEFYKVVENDICYNDRLILPQLLQRCGIPECPSWRVGEWSTCQNSPCHKNSEALVVRPLECLLSNGTVVDKMYCQTRTPPTHERICKKTECLAKWVSSNWAKCTGRCGKKGYSTRWIRCVWEGTGLPAGVNCRGLPRPTTRKACVAPACSKCNDKSPSYCSLVKMLHMCRHKVYKARCCRSCGAIKK